MKLLALPLFLLLAVPAARPGGVAAQENREVAGVAEEQALLRRQLQRLKGTMEVLLGRVEAEGRTDTAKLLREGLAVLSEREAADRTLDDLMESSREAITKGQLVAALERQEELIADLEHLLAVLLDRRNLESIQKDIDALKALQRGLDELISEERRLRDETEELRERAATPEQRALRSELEELEREQAAALADNEARGRESGAIELELLERELESLLADQRTDAGLLAAWDPSEEEDLARVQAALAEARAADARARRLARAAGELRRTAREIESASAETRQERAWAEALELDLDRAAEQEERSARVGGDPAAEAAAKALRAGAETVRASDPSTQSETGRAETAERLRDLARGLENDAEAARAPGREASERATAELERVAGGDGAARAAAQDALEALREAAGRDAAAQQAAAERAAARESGDETETARAEARSRQLEESTSRALEEAERTLRDGSEAVQFLGQAAARSQSDAAERAERIARGLATLEPGRTEDGKEAGAELVESAGSMREASQAARNEDAPTSAERAAEAVESLERALEALTRARASSGERMAEAARESAGEQAAMAEQAGSLREDVPEAGLDAESQAAVERALERAEAAMERAAAELAEGRSASAASSQREAREALQEAARETNEGVTPQSAEQEAEARDLARRQDEVRERILDLARRAEERKNARPLPSLDRADQAAQRASRALDEGDLNEAEQQEERVERELDRAREELREEEEAYQRLRQEEILFRIAEEITTMQGGHREQMAAVREIDVTRGADGSLARSMRLRLRNVAREEEALADRATEIADAIESEASEVTATLMRNVAGDLERIARALSLEGDFDTGDRTQALQKDVEESLSWLLEALKAEQERRRDESQEGRQGQDQEQPESQNRRSLVPDETELKLLRRMEVEVQDAVDEMLLRYPELSEPDEVDPLLLEEILRIASKHERVTDLFSRFRQRLGVSAEGDPPRPTPENTDDPDDTGGDGR